MQGYSLWFFTPVWTHASVGFDTCAKTSFSYVCFYHQFDLSLLLRWRLGCVQSHHVPAIFHGKFDTRNSMALGICRKTWSSEDSCSPETRELLSVMTILVGVLVFA